jgi:hypothetical protein
MTSSTKATAVPARKRRALAANETKPFDIQRTGPSARDKVWEEVGKEVAQRVVERLRPILYTIIPSYTGYRIWLCDPQTRPASYTG